MTEQRPLRIVQLPAQNDIDYLVRIVLKGDRYGLDGCCTLSGPDGFNSLPWIDSTNHTSVVHKQERPVDVEPLVEIYVRFDHTACKHLAWAGLDQPWYFVSRYNLSTFLKARNGLLLDPGHPPLVLTHHDHTRVVEWLYSTVGGDQ